MWLHEIKKLVYNKGNGKVNQSSKGSPTEWENNFYQDISNRGLISREDKELKN